MKKIYAMLVVAGLFGPAVQSQTVIPVGDELILPQYAYYGGTSNAHRMPFVCRLKLSGLTANGNYRYMTGMSSTSNLTSGTGQQAPGSMYRINNTVSANGYGYIVGFTTNKAIGGTNNIGNDMMYTAFTNSYYGQFTADASGNYTGWFAVVPTGHSTQQVNGSNVYFYVQLSGAGGTSFTQSYRTTSTIKLLNYSSVAGDPIGCTALLGTSDVGEEKMVTIYDNTAATGRPLYCTFTESNNCTTCTPVGALTEGSLFNNPVLYASVDNVSGKWAAIIPNTLSGGVKAINFYNIDGTSITLSNAPAANISTDGSWGGVATDNPAGDSTRPILINSIQSTPVTLPVKLLSFDGKMAKGGIELVWTTMQETRNKYFDIMRAGSDGQFSAIGRVNAAGGSNLTNRYEFWDNQPLRGKNFYQLKQVDDDGTSTLSKVVSIDHQKGTGGIRILSQSANELVLAISSGTFGTGRLLYTDAFGRILYSKQVMLSAGENALRIPVAQAALQLGVLTFVPEKGDRMQLKLIR